MCNKDDKINLTDLLNDVGPTVDEYLSNFKKVILPTFAINQLLELISIYREEHPNEDSVIQYNLDNLEKMLTSALKVDKQ